MVGSERDMSQAPGGRAPSVYPAYPGSGPAPFAARPPLTKRMRPVHWIAADCVLSGFLSLAGAAVMGPRVPAAQGRFLMVLLFTVLVFIPVALRRRTPVTAFGALLVLGVLLSGLSPVVPGLTFLAAAFVLYTVTVENRRRTGAAALGLVLAVIVFLVGAGGGARPRQDSANLLVPVALANVIAWMTGYSVRQRRLYIVTLQQQAASSAVAEERLRIARELHDVVAHSMSVIAVQAGYGQYVIDVSPGSAREALGAIQATSRDALEEMRRMLGVLRQQDGAEGKAGGPAGLAPAFGRPAAGGAPEPGGVPAPDDVPGPGPGTAATGQAPLAPAPGLASVDRLAERTRGAGLRVTLEVIGTPRPAPASVDLSGYRIIQEALTNVVRHAGAGASCRVSVSYTDADLVIRVTDDGGLPVAYPQASVACPGGGHGIIGMRERVHLCGGSFSAGPLPDGGFQVTATLPLPLTAAAPRGVTAAPDAGGGAAGRSPGTGPPRHENVVPAADAAVPAAGGAPAMSAPGDVDGRG